MALPTAVMPLPVVLGVKGSVDIHNQEQDQEFTPRPVQIKKAALGDRIRAWRSHHGSSARDSLQRLLATPLQTLMTVLLIAVALALPTSLLVGIGNVEKLGASWDSGAQLSVFLNTRIRDRVKDNLQQELEARDTVVDVIYISPEEAMEEFQTLSGVGEVVGLLEDNPLPPVLVVKLSSHDGGATDPKVAAALAEELRQRPEVDDVRLDLAWVQRLNAIMALLGRTILTIAILLGLGVILAVGNTVRMAIENRRDEIVVVKLVGGTDGFVRRPFLYTGLWYGLGGGILAWLLVSVGLWWLSGPVARLVGLYGSDFSIHGLGANGSAGLLALAALLGWGGAWLSVQRHLKDIEPK